MKVIVNDDCIGCGLCESICPQVFEMDGDHSQVVGNADLCPDLVKEASSACPVSAIEVD